MQRQDYANPLCAQVRSLTELVDEQVKRCFDQEKLESVLSVAEIYDIRNIYITGAGDSLAAAGAAADALESFTGVFNCKAVDTMEFSRFTPAAHLGIGEPNSPLVIGISVSGGTARIAEILEKANQIGAISLALTNKVPSRISGIAKKTFHVDTPHMDKDFPGLRSYFASLIGLIALGCRIGHVRNVLPPTAPEEFQTAIRHYVHSFEPVMDEIEEQMFELAQTWKDLELFNFVGSGPQLYSALFGLMKFYECTGRVSNYDDAEDWCHIDYHLKHPEKIGTVIFADKHSPYFKRTQETVQAAVGIKRPTLVIANADASAFEPGAVVCQIPDTPQGFEWLMPIMDYVPVTFLAAYCAVLGGRRFFNEFDARSLERTGDGTFFNRDIMTTGSSKVEIHI